MIFFSGKDSNVLRGLNVEESSGSSQHNSDEVENMQPASGNTQPASENTQPASENTQPASENSNLCTDQSQIFGNSSTFEIISIDAPASKSDLQIELLLNK